MIQYVISYLNQIKRETRYIFVVNRADCRKFHLDNTLRLLTNGNCQIVYQDGDAKGAVCSALLASEYINNDDPLIISNGDQYIEEDLNQVLDKFERKKVDAGLICFDSVHPKWSFVRIEGADQVVETAEKNPISRNAIAGFYYFRKGSDFIHAAMSTISKDSQVNGLYFIAPTYNELVLEGKSVQMHKIDNAQYHSFYSLQKIQEFEKDRPKFNPL